MPDDRSDSNQQPSNGDAPNASPPLPPPPSAPIIAETLDGPEWAQGKNRSQLIREMEDFYAALPHLDLSAPPAAAADVASSPVVAVAPAPVAAPSVPDPSLAQTDPEEWRRQFDEYNRATTQNMIREVAGRYSQPLMESQAQTARELSRRDPALADVWQRFGHEIDREMAKAPMEQRTQANYSMICDMVRGRHFDELMKERDAAPASAANATATGSAPDSASGAEPPAQTPIDGLFESDSFYARRLRESGISKSALRERLTKMQITEEDWVKEVESGGIVLTSDGSKQIVSAAGVGS